MLAISIFLGLFGIGFLCWLLLALAVYALPFFVGLSTSLAALHSGSGVIGAFIVGIFVGAATLVVGQIAFATVRSPILRVAIALLYAVPATIAGYHAVLGLAHIGVPSEAWGRAFAVVGAVVFGGTAFARMSLFAPPELGGRVGASPAQRVSHQGHVQGW